MNIDDVKAAFFAFTSCVVILLPFILLYCQPASGYRSVSQKTWNWVKRLSWAMIIAYVISLFCIIHI